MINEADVIGPECMATFRKKQKLRMKRTVEWQKHSTTRPCLAALCVGLSLSLGLMGAFFVKGAVLRPDRPDDFVSFTHVSSSPSVALIKTFLESLGDLDADLWLPVKGAAWTVDTVRLVSTMFLSFVGNLFLRTVVNFQVYPYKLALLLNDKASEEEKRAVLDDLEKVKDCTCCRDEALIGAAPGVSLVYPTIAFGMSISSPPPPPPLPTRPPTHLEP